MRRKRIPNGRRAVLLPTLLAMLFLGVLSGVALADGGDPGSSTPAATTTGDASTDPVTTTDAGPTTTEPTTTAETTTAPVTTTATTTAPVTTTAPTTTAGTTTTTGTTTGNSGPPVGQTTTQGTGTTPTTTGSVPTAPCDTTAITCGNNAATQIALVNQTCNAVQSGSILSVQVESLSGSPIDNFTLNNNTTCLNELSITQIVQQFCVGCTIIVIPPPTVQSIYVTQVLPQQPAVPAAPTATKRAAYCMPQPVLRSDGSMGTFVDLLQGQPTWDARYTGAVPATFVAGVGMTCPDGETTATGASVPVFTLTVPASFVGQYVQLCLQPANSKVQPSCHLIRIDTGATISVPVTGHVTAVVKQQTVAPADRPKSAKQIAKASSHLQSVLGAHHTIHKKRGKK